MIDYILLEKYCKDIDVLFVEDDEYIRKETKELLENIFQKKIIVAVDGKEGFSEYLDYYKEHGKYFDLIITDIKMPNLDGIELTKMIYTQNPIQPLVVLSAHNESDYLMELVNIGISQFILKPIEFNNFVNVIYKITKDIYFSNSDTIIVIEEKEIKLSEGLIWNSQLKKLLSNNIIVKLTKKELLLIEFLLKTPEKTFTNENIIIHLWQDLEDKSPDMSNLKNIISRLRKKVPTINIENIYSFGYRLNIVN